MIENPTNYPVPVTQERLLQKRVLETIMSIIERDTQKIRNIFNCMQPHEAVMILELLTKKQKKDVIKMLGLHMDSRIIYLLDSKTKQIAMNVLRKIQDRASTDSLTRDEKIQMIACNIIKYLSSTAHPDSLTLSDIAEGLAPADLASALELLTPSQRFLCINTLYTSFNPLTLTFFDPVIKEAILHAMSVPLIEHCLTSMSQADIVELIEDLSQSHIKSILDIAERVCDQEKVQDIYNSMKYDETVVGRMMMPGIIMSSRQTVREAYNRLQHISIAHKYADVIYFYDFIDEVPVLIGQLNAVMLLCLANDKKYKLDKINMHMAKIECILHTDTPIKEAGFLFKEYSVMQMPVVNPNTGKFMGVINASQAIDIISEEDQVLSLVGIQEYDFYESIWDSVKIRMQWMLMCSVATMCSVMIIRIFEDIVSKNIVMAVIMPIVPAIGGSAVSQVFTVTVRAIANQEINDVNLSRNVYKEFIAGSMLGLFIGIVIAIIVFIMTGNIYVALTVFFPMILNTAWAGLIGTVAPVILHRFGFDAAVASTFLNASTDIMGYVAVFITGKYMLSL